MLDQISTVRIRSISVALYGNWFAFSVIEIVSFLPVLEAFNPCLAEYIKMPRPFLTFSQSDYLIRIVAISSHTLWQTVQIQISWLLQKPTDLDLHCLQKQGISGFSMTRVNNVAFSVWGIRPFNCYP